MWFNGDRDIWIYVNSKTRNQLKTKYQYKNKMALNICWFLEKVPYNSDWNLEDIVAYLLSFPVSNFKFPAVSSFTSLSQVAIFVFVLNLPVGHWFVPLWPF